MTLKALPVTDTSVAYEFELDDGQKTNVRVSHAAALLMVQRGQTLKDFVIEQACKNLNISLSEVDIHGTA